MKELDSLNRNKGYNIRYDSEGKCFVSDETKELMSISQKERYKSEEEKIKFYKNNAEIKTKRTTLFNELKHVKNDLLMGTNTSNNKYHKFINETRIKLFNDNENIIEKINKTPLKYLFILLRINKDLETKDCKMFQPLPLRTDLCNKFLSIDTGAISDIFKFTIQKRKKNNITKIKKIV